MLIAQQLYFTPLFRPLGVSPSTKLLREKLRVNKKNNNIDTLLFLIVYTILYYDTDTWAFRQTVVSIFVCEHA